MSKKAPQDLFEDIRAELVAQQESVTPGPMMSSPGIKANGKVFAFFHEASMTFRLGKEFRPEDYHIEEWEWLSPFVNKPPMKGWFTISPKHSDKWHMLAQIAFEKM